MQGAMKRQSRDALTIENIDEILPQNKSVVA
jgi:hypothetical protein